MTQREIITALIPMYEEAIEKAREFEDWQAYKAWLYNNDIEDGICQVIELRIEDSMNEFGETDYEWIKQYNETYSVFWYKTPWESKSIPEAVECLTYRLNKLKEILSSLEG